MTVVIGAGSIGQAIARRISSGHHVVAPGYPDWEKSCSQGRGPEMT